MQVYLSNDREHLKHIKTIKLYKKKWSIYAFRGKGNMRNGFFSFSQVNIYPERERER